MLKILIELRKAAKGDTKLVIIDKIINPVCHDATLDGKGILGAATKDAPEPLLANFGVANTMNYDMDVAVR